MEEKKGKSFLNRLKNRYRLVIMNDETFEEKVWLKLTPLNIFVIGGSTIIGLIFLVIYLVAFTSLKEYIPGYADVTMQRNVFRLTILADSLQKELEFREQYMENLKQIMGGNPGLEDTSRVEENRPSFAGEIPAYSVSPEDSELRAMVESESRFQLMHSPSGKENKTGTSRLLFFPPLKGTITQGFRSSEKHFGVDIASAPDLPVKAALDGTILVSTWTTETGHIIGIQHHHNFVTFYKHNSVLLKKVGDRVRAGEPVAIIGNSGDHSSGPHLHFEIWLSGEAVNPADYISF